MHWRTHLSIAKWIGRTLKLDRETILKLADGSIAPDKWKDYPHHNVSVSNRKIYLRITRARRFFLKNDNRCFFELGAALHYIADKFVVTPSSDPGHVNLEEEIDKVSRQLRRTPPSGALDKEISSLDFKEEDKELLTGSSIVQGKERTLLLASIAPSRSIKFRIDALLVLRIVYRICFKVTKAILSSKTPPNNLRHMFKGYIDNLNLKLSRLKVYAIAIILLPLVIWFKPPISPVTYLGPIAYGAIIMYNLMTLLPIVLILRKDKKKSKIKACVKLKENSITLYGFFFLVAATFLLVAIRIPSRIWPISVICGLLGLLHLYCSRLLPPVDKDIKEEVDWYAWES